MKQNEKTGKFYVLIAVALLVTSVAVAVAVAGPAPYPGTGPTPTPGPTPAPGPGGGPAPYPTPAPPPPPPTPTPPPGALPDLVVEDKWETFANGDVIVHFTVKNIGNAQARSSTACKYINGIEVDTVSIPPLGATTNCTRAFDPEPCTPGTTITVTVCADNYDVVDESDETNNCMTNTFTCPAGPQPGGADLVVNITKPVTKRKVTIDQCEYKVEWTATNIGNKAAIATWVALFVDGVKVDEEACMNLGPLATDSGEFFGWVQCPLACGENVDVVEVRVDYYNEVGESNEGNNNDSTIADCRRGDIEVQKTVWDGLIRVEEIDAVYGDVVKFNCTVHNIGCCCNLTNITVTDVLSDSLEYINATPAPDIVSIAGGVTTLTWEYKDVTDILEPCEWLNYTINATVIGCGVDTNTQTAVATNCTGGEVTDTDTATVNVAVPDPRIGADKKVWDGDSWEDVNATAINIQQRYRCTVHNTGCCDLTNVVVQDTLPVGLLYDGVEAGTPAPQQVIGNVGIGTTLVWTVPAPFEHCEVEEYIILATPQLAAGTLYTNILDASGYCAATNTYVDDDADADSQT